MIPNTLLPSESNLPDALASAALLSSLLLAWLLARRALRARENLPEQVSRRWAANFRNALVLIAVIGLLMIWAPQLRTFALSITAVAVAIVVATKELILCLSGSTFRTFTRAYTIGDLVQIGDHRGEVVDINLMSTRLRELDTAQGSIRATRQSVIVPHSLLFSQPARVLAKDGQLAEHSFALAFESGVDLFAQRAELERIAKTAMHAVVAQDKANEAGAVRVAVMTTDLGRLRLEISVDTLPRHAGDLQVAIASALGSHVLGEMARAKADSARDT